MIALEHGPEYSPQEIARRVRIAGQIIDASPPRAPIEFLPFGLTRRLTIPFPQDEAPLPQPFPVQPAVDDPLPQADVVLFTYTIAEGWALADVFTPGHGMSAPPGSTPSGPYDPATTPWYAYSENYDTVFAPILGRRSNARKTHVLCSYFLTTVNGLRVLCCKSNLHVSRDYKNDPNVVPLGVLVRQIIQEVQPQWFLTTGTAGGLAPAMQLGDVAVTRSATFACQAKYAQARFNHQNYRSQCTVPTARLATAQQLMQGFTGHLNDEGEPSCGCGPWSFPTAIYHDGADGIAPFFPVLTTDYFEYGTSTNGLDQLGISVEMDDAVVGMVCQTAAAAPSWLSVRNLSDRCVNGALSKEEQHHCAILYYKKLGYWTSVMSALTCWGIVAGLAAFHP